MHNKRFALNINIFNLKYMYLYQTSTVNQIAFQNTKAKQKGILFLIYLLYDILMRARAYFFYFTTGK